MSSRLQSASVFVAIAAVGGAGGWLLAGLGGSIGGAFLGAVGGAAAVRTRMRPLVAITVAIGTITGALVGQGVVAALCLPGNCPGLEALGAVMTGLGALVGVGMVVALVVRSFDEYHEAIAANRPPPSPGCETGGEER